jgi:pimeloyl-ACP methyl ester carboxylesterase
MVKWIAGVAGVLIAALVVLAWATSEPEIARAVMENKYATPPSRFVELADGSRIHYRDRGPRDAPVLIVLHGFAGSLFVWEPWSRSLSDRFRVVSLDLPGNGLTGPVPSGDYSQRAMTETLRAFADKLGLKRFALAGNSMGGAVAAQFAERYPERVAALILIDSSGSKTNTRPRFHIGYYVAHIPVVSRFVLRRFVDGRYRFKNMEGMSEALTAHFRLRDEPYVWEHAGDIKAPVLILWGGRDRLIPLAAAKAWQGAIRGSRLIVYPRAGHVAMADAPGPSAADARAFLSEHAIRR